MNINFRTLLAALPGLLALGVFCIPARGGPAAKDAPVASGLGRLLPLVIDYERPEVCAPFGINSRGQIVGRAGVGPTQKTDADHAFLSIGGKMTDLGTLPDYTGGSCAFSINDSGQIVGCSSKEEDYDNFPKDTRAFLYDKGVMTGLGTLGGDYSKAVVINNSGLIAGISTTATGETHAFLYEDGKMRDLGSYKDFRYFEVNGMNESGELVGSMSADVNDNDPHAFYYKNGAFHDLGTFGGASSIAHAVNNAGDIAGEYSLKGKSHAFLYSGGKMRDLTASVDTRASLGAIATQMNNRGDILILVRRNDHTAGNYLWHGGKTVELRALLGAKSIYIPSSIAAINDTRQLICFGRVPGGEDAGFLLTLPKAR